MPLKDVVVTINIKSIAPRVGLGRPLILAMKTGTASYKEYRDIDEVLTDYAVTTPEYKKAAVIFVQPNRPDLIAIATYAVDPAITLTEFYNRGWHFALVANDLPADQLKAATYLDSKDFKIGAYQVINTAGRTALKGKKRAIVFDNPNTSEYLDAAAVGNLASLTVGSITWKFKDLVGVTPRYLTDTELAAIEADNANAYVMKSGKGQLSDGKLADGEFIDIVHGQDWIKADMENEIQNTLQSSPKLPYDIRGINSLAAAATTTLKRGFNNGIIGFKEDGLPDYQVEALPKEQSDVQDRKNRIYRGLSFEFGSAGAIHDVRVKGSIII